LVAIDEADETEAGAVPLETGPIDVVDATAEELEGGAETAATTAEAWSDWSLFRAARTVLADSLAGNLLPLLPISKFCI